MQIAKCLISLVVLLGFHWSHADVDVVSSYGMVLSPDEIKTLFSELELKGTESYQLQDFTIETPFKTELKGISLSGAYSANMTLGSSTLDFSIAAKMSGLVLRVQKISTDTVLRKNIGGINVEIFLKGFCENVEIKSSDEATLTSQVQLQVAAQGLQPSVQNTVVNQLPQWQVTMGQCQGPTGYDKALQAEIRNILTNKAEVQKIIMNPITAKIQSIAQTINQKIFATKDMQLANKAKVQLKPESLQVIGNNKLFLLTGKATAQFSSEKTGSAVVDDTAFASRLALAEQTGVYLSQKWVQESVLKAKDLNLLGYSFSSSSIDSLKSLFSSRLYQFFLWPDLMRFARNVEFLFRLQLERLNKLTFLSTNDGALWYDFQGVGGVATKAPLKNGYGDYGDFGVNLKTRFWVKMYKGVAVVGAYDPKFNLNFSWNKIYLALFNPFKSISVAYFGSKIESTLKKEKYSIAAPEIEVSESVHMVAEEISGDSEILFLRYTTKGK